MTPTRIDLAEVPQQHATEHVITRIDFAPGHEDEALTRAAAGSGGRGGGAGMSAQHTPGPDWYERRDELQPGMVFRSVFGGLVQLDCRVPGDGTKWTVLDWCDGWCACGSEIEPSDLQGEPIADVARATGSAA